jgi:hypothetical protein
MDDAAQASTPKAATAARIYDYYLGGIHNFPADQEAAKQVTALFPFVPGAARSNRAFLRRAVRQLADAGVRQFLDIGSGIPTVGNVHEIVQEIAPESRIVYVDIDPVAVAESLEILEGNQRVIAIRGDLRNPDAILDHPAVKRLLDFSQPVGLLLAAVLHFVPEDTEAYDSVAQLVAALPPGSYLVLSHSATESFRPISQRVTIPEDVYRRRTATPGTVRAQSEVERFFAGLELLDPGVVWADEWRPDPDEPVELVDGQPRSGIWAGVASKK